MNLFQRFMVTVFGGFFDKRLWASTGASRSTTAKVDVSEDTALNYSAVWAATRLICGTCANFSLPVYRSGDDGETRTKLLNHPVSRLLNIEPNPDMDAFNFRSVMWQWQINWGNAYAEIVREGDIPDGEVLELWPLHPALTTPKRDESERLYYEFRNQGREPTILQPWQVLHLPSVLTRDGLVGMGVVEHARETIGAGIAKEKKAAHQLGGGGVPQVVVETAGRWGDDVRAAFRKEWKELHGGPEGDTVAVLQGGATAKPLMGFSEKDSQFLESRQFDIEEIARWYGIPPHLLQHLLRATFNNVEELGIDFVRYCLLPWLGIWHNGIRRKLFTRDEQAVLFVEHDVDELMDGNAQARGALYQVLTSSAIMTRNECRKRENLDPVPGGDVFLVQGAMVPLDDDGKPESEFVNPKPAADSPSSSTDSTDSEQIRELAANGFKRVMSRDLKRMLRRERDAIKACAKKPTNFMADVDGFYTEHVSYMLDVMSASTSTLSDLGVWIDCGKFVSEWVDEGKSLAFDIAGAATPEGLPEAVQGMVESRNWSERPERAIERVKNAVSA